MTIEEAIRILNPKRYSEAIAEVEYYAGFNGMDAKAVAFALSSEGRKLTFTPRR